MSATSSASAVAAQSVEPTVRSTAVRGTRRVNAATTAPATCSAQAAVARTRRRPAEDAWPTSRRVRSASRTSSRARVASARPPGVSAMPVPVRRNSGSPRSARSAATAADTAGSLTPSAVAAARSDPSSATSANVRSWANVMLGHPHNRSVMTMLTVTWVTDKLRGHQGSSSGVRR